MNPPSALKKFNLNVFNNTRMSEVKTPSPPTRMSEVKTPSPPDLMYRKRGLVPYIPTRAQIETQYRCKMRELKRQRERYMRRDLKYQSGNDFYFPSSLFTNLSEIEVKFIETYWLYVYQLIKCKSGFEVFAAVMQFLETRTSGSLIRDPSIRAVISYISECFSEFVTPNAEHAAAGSLFYRAAREGVGEAASAARRQYDSFFDINQASQELARIHLPVQDGEEFAPSDHLKWWPRLRRSVLWKKLSKVIVYVTSMSIFGYKDVTPASAEKLDEAMNSFLSVKFIDFTHAALEAFQFICKKGYQLYKTGDIDCIFHSESEYDEWWDDVTKVKHKSNFLSNPKPHGFTIFSFCSDLESALERGYAIKKYVQTLDSRVKATVIKTLAELEMIKAMQLNSVYAMKTRRAPLVLLLEGDTAVGKTTFGDLLHSYYSTYRGLKVEGTRFNRNANAKFWDGFRSHMHSCLFDDIGAVNPKYVQGLDPSLQEFLAVCNNTPCMPDQASLEDKGATPFMCELLVATTNTPLLNLAYYFSCPLAVARRMPYHIRISVKKEYCIEGTTSMSSAKVPPLTDAYPSYWDIEILKPVSISETQVAHKFTTAFSLESVCKFENIIPFLKWYKKEIDQHHVSQDKIIACTQMMAKTELCLECSLPIASCECLKLQSGIIDYFSLADFIVILCVLRVIYEIFMNAIRPFIDAAWLSAYIRLKTLILRDIEPKACLAIAGKYMAACVPKWLNSLLVCIAAMILAYALYIQTNRLVNQGGINSHMGVDPVSGTEKENVWYNKQYEVTNFDVGRKTSSFKGLRPEVIQKTILNNCASLEYIVPGVFQSRLRFAKIFGIGGQYYLINNHMLDENYTKYIFKYVVSSEHGLSGNRKFSLGLDDVVRYPEQDIALIKIACVPDKKNVIDLFVRERALNYRGSATYLGVNKDGSILNVAVSDVDHDTQNGIHYSCGVVKLDTKDGDCGSILYANTGQGPVLLGIHQQGGKLNRIMAINVTHEFLTSITEGLFIISPNAPMMKSRTSEQVLGELHPKSPARFVEQGCVNTYGSFLGFRGHQKSSVVRSIVCPFLLKEGYKLDFGTPKMSGYKPWRNGLIKAVSNGNMIMKCDLDACVASLFHKWCLPVANDTPLQIYDMATCVNGKPGLKYVDSINRATSAGFPHKKSKKYFIEYLPDDELHQDDIIFNEEIMERVEEMLACYQDKYRASPVFSAAIKDEPRKHSKIAADDLRIFMGSPIEFTLVMRMFLLSFVRHIQMNKYHFESAPGTAAQTDEWHDMYNYLTHFDDQHMVAGDFAAYDLTMTPEIIFACFELIAKYHEFKKCDPQHSYVIRCIGHDVAFSFTDFNGDLFEFFGINPSGQALTVVINCIANCLYMRFTYLKLNPKNECKTFSDFVNLITYGDDNVLGISPNIPWFNHTTISGVFADHGIKYTMADKEAISIPYIPMKEVTFLKRSWRFEDELDKYVCPLDEASIIKSMMICNKSKYIAEEAQMVDIIHSANDEYFWHGRDKFEKMQILLLRILKSHNLDSLMSRPLSNWSQLKARYFAACNDDELIHDDEDTIRREKLLSERATLRMQDGYTENIELRYDDSIEMADIPDVGDSSSEDHNRDNIDFDNLAVCDTCGQTTLCALLCDDYECLSCYVGNIDFDTTGVCDTCGETTLCALICDDFECFSCFFGDDEDISPF